RLTAIELLPRSTAVAPGGEHSNAVGPVTRRRTAVGPVPRRRTAVGPVPRRRAAVGPVPRRRTALREGAPPQTAAVPAAVAAGAEARGHRLRTQVGKEAERPSVTGLSLPLRVEAPLEARAVEPTVLRPAVRGEHRAWAGAVEVVGVAVGAGDDKETSMT